MTENVTQPTCCRKRSLGDLVVGSRFNCCNNLVVIFVFVFSACSFSFNVFCRSINTISSSFLLLFANTKSPSFLGISILVI